MASSTAMVPSTATPPGLTTNRAGIAAIPTTQSATARGIIVGISFPMSDVLLLNKSNFQMQDPAETQQDPSE